MGMARAPMPRRSGPLAVCAVERCADSRRARRCFGIVAIGLRLGHRRKAPDRVSLGIQVGFNVQPNSSRPQSSLSLIARERAAARGKAQICGQVKAQAESLGHERPER
jgi:hypothetical protein